MLASSSASSTGQLSQLGASLYGPQSKTSPHTHSPLRITDAAVDHRLHGRPGLKVLTTLWFLSKGALGFPMRGMNSSAAPPLSRSGLNQSASQLSSHTSTPNTGTMLTPSSPSRYASHLQLHRRLDVISLIITHKHLVSAGVSCP